MDKFRNLIPNFLLNYKQTVVLICYKYFALLQTNHFPKGTIHFLKHCQIDNFSKLV